MKKIPTLMDYVLQGKGMNGKGVILRILTRLLGSKNISTEYMSSFEDNRFIGYNLYCKSANIAADGGTEDIEKTGMIKAILGNDAISCEQKFHNTFSYTPYCTMIFTFNELPLVLDSSDGFNRKIQPIKFTKQFSGDLQDNSVEDIREDDTEMAGILNKLLPICKRMIVKQKLINPSSIDEVKQMWTMANDSFFRFSREEIISIPGEMVLGDVVFRRYTDCCETWGMTALQERAFNSRMTDWLGEDKKGRSRIGGKLNVVWNQIVLKYNHTKQGTVD